ncbi:MAG: MFS transporter [Magnetospiraceae bacterium]
MTQSTPASNGKFWPWILWGWAATFYFYGFFQRVAPSVMVTDLMADFAVSAVVLGNLSAFYFYAYASIQLPVGLILDSVGPRRSLFAAALLCGLGSALFGLSNAVETASMGRALVGLGAGFTWVGALKVITLWFPPHRFAMMSGLTLMLGMVGAVTGQGPLGLLVDAAGWRHTMMLASGFGAVLAVGFWFLFPKEDVSARTSHQGGARILGSLKAVLGNPQSWVAALFGAMMTVPLLAFYGLWGVPYLMTAFNLERPVAATIISIGFMGWGVGAPLAGWLSDRFGRRKLPMLLSATGSAVTISAILYLPGLPLVLDQVLLFVNGVLSGGMVLCFALGREHNQIDHAGAATGFVNTAVMSTGAIFQPFVGYLLDQNWNGALENGARVYDVEAYNVAMLVMPIAAIGAVTVASFGKETFCKQVHRS